MTGYMKKHLRILSLFIVCLTSANLYSQEEDDRKAADEEKKLMKAQHIRAVEIWITDYRNDSLIGKKHLAEKKTYNPSGTIAKHSAFDKDGKEDYTATYEYDAKDNLVKKSVKSVNGTNVTDNTEQYNYDEKGKLKEKNTPVDKTLYEYDAQGRTWKEKVYDKSGKGLLKEFNYTYDPKGNLTLWTLKNSEEQGLNQIATTYDEQNRETKRTKVNASGKLLSDKMFTWSKEGDLTVKITQFAGLLTANGKAVEKFNNKNKRVEYKHYNAKGAITIQTAYTYDPAGLILTGTEQTRHTKKEYEYKYIR